MNNKLLYCIIKNKINFFFIKTFNYLSKQFVFQDNSVNYKNGEIYDLTPIH